MATPLMSPLTGRTSPTDSAVERFVQLMALEMVLKDDLAELWAQVDENYVQETYFGEVVPPLMAELETAQESAAQIGADYVEAESGEPGPYVRAGQFAGFAAGGGELGNRFIGPMVEGYMRMQAGQPYRAAMASVRIDLDEMLASEVQDAARAAEITAIAGNKRITGYVRMVEAGACDRCVVMAGRRYKWNAGFRRHPRCRCHHIPLGVAGEQAFKTAAELFDEMDPEDQDLAFGKANAEAIRKGADISRVVNARSGMGDTVQRLGRNLRTTGVMAGRGIRLTPESILKLADDDQDEAIRLLRLHKYIA